MLLHYRRKLGFKFGENYTAFKTCFILLALTRWNLNQFLQFFKCWKKYKQNSKKSWKTQKNFFKSSLERFMRAV